MRVTLFDYGAGNLHSLAKALAAEGVTVQLETDPAAAADTDLLVLPGAGAFGAAAARLAPGRDRIRGRIEEGMRVLGVCLGMQLLFDRSEEGEGRGLGVFPGDVRRLAARRVPHIGWNTLETAGDPLFARSPLDCAWYANSFACAPEDPSAVIAWTTHESVRFPAAVRRGAAVGVQFHPEKSGTHGVRWLSAFLEECRTCA